jgi:hypothetical protein
MLNSIQKPKTVRNSFPPIIPVIALLMTCAAAQSEPPSALPTPAFHFKPTGLANGVIAGITPSVETEILGGVSFSTGSGVPALDFAPAAETGAQPAVKFNQPIGDFTTDFVFTISLWVMPIRSSIPQTYFSNPGGGPTLQMYNSLNILANNGHWHYTSKEKIPYGDWCNLTFTSDGSVIQLYLNGEPIGEKVGFSGKILNLQNGFQIGGGNFIGSISEVGIYNSTLTPEQVRQIYSNPPR